MCYHAPGWKEHTRAIEFTEEERGKTVYIAASWQNHRGNIGQWSVIQNAVVP